LLLLGFVDSGLRSVSNSLNRFGFFFLAGGSVVPPAIGVLGCSLVLLLLLIDSYIGIIELTTGSSMSFGDSCSGSSITSGSNSCIISASIGLIGRYLDVILYVIISSTISS
jgi:hypothetical protein